MTAPDPAAWEADSRSGSTTAPRTKPWSYAAALWWSVPCSMVGLSLIGNELMAGGYTELVGYFVPGAIIAALIVAFRRATGRTAWLYSKAITASAGLTLGITVLAALNGAGDHHWYITYFVLLALLLPGAALAALVVTVRNRSAR